MKLNVLSNVCWRCWWCCQVSKGWLNTTDCSTLPPGVLEDADCFSGEVAVSEASSLGLEADEACDEARVTVSKPCAHILLLLHCHHLPSVLGIQHVGCEVVERDGILESLVDNFLEWVECRFWQEAQPECRGSFTLVAFNITPLSLTDVKAIEFICN